MSAQFRMGEGKIGQLFADIWGVPDSKTFGPSFCSPERAFISIGRPNMRQTVCLAGRPSNG